MGIFRCSDGWLIVLAWIYLAISFGRLPLHGLPQEKTPPSEGESGAPQTQDPHATAVYGAPGRPYEDWTDLKIGHYRRITSVDIPEGILLWRRTGSLGWLFSGSRGLRLWPLRTRLAFPVFSARRRSAHFR